MGSVVNRWLMVMEGEMISLTCKLGVSVVSESGLIHEDLRIKEAALDFSNVVTYRRRACTAETSLRAGFWESSSCRDGDGTKSIDVGRGDCDPNRRIS